MARRGDGLLDDAVQVRVVADGGGLHRVPVVRDAAQPDVAGAAFDLVFLDPPYGKGMGERALASAARGGWIAKGATIVWEESRPPVATEGFALLDQRKYGDTVISILEAL